MLIAGGNDANNAAQSSAEWFDPASGTSTAAGDLVSAQIGHSATLLRDGRVLIAGGLDFDSRRRPDAAAAELFDPVSGRFSRTADYAVGNALYPPGQGPIWPRDVLLHDGTVLLTGNAIAEIFDPSAGIFRATGAMRGAAYQFGMWGHTATLLHDGTVLVAGGDDEWGQLDVAERYDPATAAFSVLPPMNQPRTLHSATLLPDGRVLLAGGESRARSPDGRIGFAGSLSGTEYYDPATQAFTRGPAMRQNRTAHTATLLADGSVLIVGGVDFAPLWTGRKPITLQSAERHVATGMCAKRYPNRCAATR
ncbi:MAG TPA: kelch repeat-containing protein [Xanthomonadales bacterium]|nr:kelch repeat-containing protein [Xanthomonadales bacterium]